MKFIYEWGSVTKEKGFSVQDQDIEARVKISVEDGKVVFDCNQPGLRLLAKHLIVLGQPDYHDLMYFDFWPDILPLTSDSMSLRVYRNDEFCDSLLDGPGVPLGEEELWRNYEE
jgi:hypothetical protein